jgi:hypothetical protein
MSERDPIDLIRDQLGRAETMGGLHADHEAFKQWHSETKTILEKAFSPKSVHYQSFLALRFREISVKSFASPEIDKINAARFKKDLETARNVLHGAIKELTLDRTLFKKIQTTPKTVEVSFQGECFLSVGSSEPQIVQAIEMAFEGGDLNLICSDETSRKDEPLRQRMEKIRRARLGIFSLSVPEEADILVELGIALGLGKEVWVVHRKGTILPDVLQSLDQIEYENFPGLTEAIRRRKKSGQ